METCNTWQCINSFAPWLSAVGTITISGIALWLSLRDKFIRLRSNFSGGLIPSYDPQKLDTYVYILDFVNIGAREVKIVNFEWHSRKLPVFKKIRSVIHPYQDDRVARFSSKFPVRLKDGESGQIVFANDFIEVLEQPELFIFSKNSVQAFIQIFSSNIYLCTSVGKKIKVTMKTGIRKELWNKYKKYNKPL